MSPLHQPARRLALGQWFTPPEVADLALAMALPPGGAARARLRVLDPACGDGVFLARAAAAGVGQGGLVGIELDPAAAAAARAAVPGATVRRADLFDLAAGAIGERGAGDDGSGEPGFDAVVGNPPYVRQERLDRDQKQRVERRLAEDWPDLSAVDRQRLIGRADLAASVVARSLRLCRPGGRAALVVSSALLDATYADALWRLIERHGRVEALIEAPAERWFHDAAVNTIILVLERSADRGHPVRSSQRAAPPRPEPTGTGTDTVAVARLRVPTAVAARRVRGPHDLVAVAEVRRAPADSPRSWAEALRAPAAWFEFARAAGERLVPLGELVEIRRGVTSGANEIFYLPRDRAASLELEAALLAPLLRSPREAGSQTIAVDPRALPTVALVAPAGVDALARFPAARRYIASHAGAAERPTLRARTAWWALAARPARLFLTKAYAGRFVQRFAPGPVVADQRLYSLHPRPGVDLELLAAVLNSTFTALALEALGRASLGEGALEWTVGDAAHLPVLDPRRLHADRGPGPSAGAARAALAAIAHRPIGPVEAERPRADRAGLDRAIGGALTELLPDVHDALCAAVARRAARAASGSGPPAG